METDRNKLAIQLEQHVYLQKELTERIIGCAIAMHRELRVFILCASASLWLRQES